MVCCVMSICKCWPTLSLGLGVGWPSWPFCVCSMFSCPRCFSWKHCLACDCLARPLHMPNNLKIRFSGLKSLGFLNWQRRLMRKERKCLDLYRRSADVKGGEGRWLHGKGGCLRPCLVHKKICKIFLYSPSHRILRHMHEALNIDKKITNYIVYL